MCRLFFFRCSFCCCRYAFFSELLLLYRFHFSFISITSHFDKHAFCAPCVFSWPNEQTVKMMHASVLRLLLLLLLQCSHRIADTWKVACTIINPKKDKGNAQRVCKTIYTYDLERQHNKKKCDYPSVFAFIGLPKMEWNWKLFMGDFYSFVCYCTKFPKPISLQRGALFSHHLSRSLKRAHTFASYLNESGKKRDTQNSSLGLRMQFYCSLAKRHLHFGI